MGVRRQGSYQRVLERELAGRGLRVERQKKVGFEYSGAYYEDGLRLDLLVEDVVVELKSVEALAPVHFKQVLTYLRLMDLPLGYLVNFGAPLLKDGGIRRILNAYRPHQDFKRAPTRSQACNPANAESPRAR